MNIEFDGPCMLVVHHESGRSEKIPWMLARRSIDAEFRAAEERANRQRWDVLGKRILALRQSKGLSCRALANLAQVPESIVGKIEKGQGPPPWEALQALAQGLDLPLSVLTLPDAEE